MDTGQVGVPTGGLVLDYVSVISGGIVNVASDLVDVTVVGPTGFGDPNPNVQVLGHFHSQNDGVDHLIEEVGVGQV
ncbi:hypothetical protein SLE2022_086080 [Rubroshorea leprosula]